MIVKALSGNKLYKLNVHIFSVTCTTKQPVFNETMENSCKFVRARNCGRIDSCTKVEIRLILVYSSTLVLLGDPEGFSIELINLARICA